MVNLLSSNILFVSRQNLSRFIIFLFKKVPDVCVKVNIILNKNGFIENEQILLSIANSCISE